MLTVQEIEALCAVAGLELHIYRQPKPESYPMYYIADITKERKHVADSHHSKSHLYPYTAKEHAANAAWNNYIKENT